MGCNGAAVVAVLKWAVNRRRPHIATVLPASRCDDFGRRTPEIYVHQVAYADPRDDIAVLVRPQRFGDRVFPFRPTSEHGEITSRTLLPYLVSDIGKTAGIEVEAIGKTATAKHFRSSFVTRWSLRGMPLELIQSMVRHASRSTTERYYLGDVNAAREFDESNWVGAPTGDQFQIVG